MKASGKILFHDATFSSGICFEELNCTKRVEFTGSNFADQKSENLPLSFSGLFGCGADFSNCDFTAFVQFSGVTFSGVQVVHQTTFENAVFHQDAIFVNIQFGAADFRRSTFRGEFTLHNVHAASSFDFSHSEFHWQVSFFGQVGNNEMSVIYSLWIMDHANFCSSAFFEI